MKINKLIYTFFSYIIISSNIQTNNPNILQETTLIDFLNNEQLYTSTPLGQSLHDIKNQISTIVICCPQAITGGPENLCQIYKALKNKNFNVYFLWTDKFLLKKTYKNNSWYLCGHETTFFVPQYSENYQIEQLTHEIPLDNTTLIIVPEIWCDFIYFFTPAHTIISWLSINNRNAFNNSKICQKFIDNNQLYQMPCIHVSQAPWIQKTLISWGAHALLLGDYIASAFFTTPKKQKIKTSIIVYNGSKGTFLAQQFIKNHPEYHLQALQGLDQKNMIKTLDQAQIYIDFGNFPGKDRIPREALLRDCVIFIHNAGCASDFDSFPIPNYFKFSDEDVNNGALAFKIKETLENYESMKILQNDMLTLIHQEYNQFIQNIDTIFGNPKT